MKRMHWKSRLQKKKLNAKKKSNQQSKVPKLLPELLEARSQIPVHLKLQVQHLLQAEVGNSVIRLPVVLLPGTDNVGELCMQELSLVLGYDPLCLLQYLVSLSLRLHKMFDKVIGND